MTAKHFLLALAILALLGTANAATYYVDAVNGNDGNPGTSEQPWKTIAKAEASAVNGSTVFLRSGNYGEVTINRTGLNRSSWADGVVYIADSDQNPVFSSLWISGYQNRYLTFQNIEITAPNNSNYGAGVVQVLDSSHIKIIDCNVTGRWVESGPNGYPVYYAGVVVSIRSTMDSGQYVNDVLIEGCDIQKAENGIVLSYDIGNDVIIRKNHVHIVGSSLITTNTSHGNGNILIEYNHIHDQRMSEGAHGSGIAVRDSHLTIRGNTIHDFGGSGGIRFYGGPPAGFTHEDILIENNLIYDAQGTTNQHFGSIKGNVTVRNNTFIGWKGGGTGVSTYGTVAGFGSGGNANGVYVYNNIFVGVVTVDTTINNFLENSNIFWSFAWGAFNYLSDPLGDHSIIISHGSGYNDAYNANYFENSNNFFIGGDLFEQYSYKRVACSDAQIICSHKQNLNDGYKLAENSPAIGFADPTKAPATDLFGNPRDSQPDAGCYEYVSTVPPLYGDISGDGQVTAFDAALAAHIAVGLSNPDIKNPAAAEVSGDAKVTAYDAALIAQRAEGIINKFPIE